MMRAVSIRELIVIAGKPAWLTVIGLHVGLLAAFVIVWHRGVPVLSGANVYEQQRLFQVWLLAALLPWTATRCLAPEWGNGLVATCALTALRPSSVILAKIVALSAALTLVVLAGFPAVIVAQQMSAIPLSDPIRDQLSLLGVTPLVAAVTMAWVLAVGDRLVAWVGATVFTAVTLLALSHAPLAGVPVDLMSTLVGITLALSVASWSDRALLYLAEPTSEVQA